MHVTTYGILGKSTEIKVRSWESTVTLEFDYTSTFYVKDLDTAKRLLAAAQELVAQASSLFPATDSTMFPPTE
jgi:hypothetical protein